MLTHNQLRTKGLADAIGKLKFDQLRGEFSLLEECLGSASHSKRPAVPSRFSIYACS